MGISPDLPVSQTTLVVQAVTKDQEGDAAAALSLYCKALDFFVPALHCKWVEPWAQQGWVNHSCCGWFQKHLPIQSFMGDKAEGKSGIQCF